MDVIDSREGAMLTVFAESHSLARKSESLGSNGEVSVETSLACDDEVLVETSLACDDEVLVETSLACDDEVLVETALAEGSKRVCCDDKVFLVRISLARGRKGGRVRERAREKRTL
jgi:hypothetical protein